MKQKFDTLLKHFVNLPGLQVDEGAIAGDDDGHGEEGRCDPDPDQNDERATIGN